MRVDRAALIRGLAAAAKRECARRQAAEQARADEEVRELLRELVQMGARMTAVTVPGGRRDAELAQELARAENWRHVTELCEGVDMAPAECVALVMTVDPAAAVRLLAEYAGA